MITPELLFAFTITICVALTGCAIALILWVFAKACREMFQALAFLTQMREQMAKVDYNVHEVLSDRTYADNRRQVARRSKTPVQDDEALRAAVIASRIPQHGEVTIGDTEPEDTPPPAAATEGYEGDDMEPVPAGGRGVYARHGDNG